MSEAKDAPDDPLKDLAEGIVFAGGTAAFIVWVVSFALTCWWMPSWKIFVWGASLTTLMFFALFSVLQFLLPEGREQVGEIITKALGGLSIGLLVASIAGGLFVTGYGWADETTFAPGDDSPIVYDDVECNALLGFARRDDITSSETAAALNEYDANC